jgi:hypothetical protein
MDIIPPRPEPRRIRILEKIEAEENNS